jgi:polyisoprenoid-binding protein YceI
MKIRKSLAALALASLFAAPAFADTYAIDPTHTFARFSYSHFGYSTQLSRFNKTAGTVEYDATAHKGAVEVSVDTTSVDTGFPLFDGHIQGEDFLDTGKFPTATFKSTAVTFNGEKPTSIEGTLTIKGVTKPVTLTVTSFQNMLHPMLKRDALGANATAIIKRSDFNAGKYAPYVGDEVTLSISLEAIKQ